MNTDVFMGKWHQLKGEVKSRWGKLTDDDLDRVEGDTEQLIGRVQRRIARGCVWRRRRQRQHAQSAPESSTAQYNRRDDCRNDRRDIRSSDRWRRLRSRRRSVHTGADGDRPDRGALEDARSEEGHLHRLRRPVVCRPQRLPQGGGHGASVGSSRRSTRPRPTSAPPSSRRSTPSRTSSPAPAPTRPPSNPSTTR